MIKIGLLDDDIDQIRRVRRTIKTNALSMGLAVDKDYEFVEYWLDDSEKSVAELSREIMNDINENDLDCIIIDYKLVHDDILLKGTDVFKVLYDNIREFPVVILTEIVEDSIQPLFIDSDKVYAKNQFFSNDAFAEEKTNHIFDSISKYRVRRESLESKFEELKCKFEKNGYDDPELLGQLLDVETELSRFKNIGIGKIDHLSDDQSIKELLNIIDEIKKL